MIYFDHNATTPLLPAARDAWLQATDEFIGNPSSPHRLGSRADKALEDARQQLAAVLGCSAMDIVWTSGATESNNMVLHHAGHTWPADRQIWISAVEHPCVMQATQFYFPPPRHQIIPVLPDGKVDLDWIAHNLAESPPALVAVMAANNETGILQPWREVMAMCRQYEVPFFCDAVQWLGKLPAHGLGEADYVSGCAHKFGGPKGVGFLKCPSRQRLQPLLRGGPQEDRRRAGTENLAGVLSMMAALECRGAEVAQGAQNERANWSNQFIASLQSQVPGTLTVGGDSSRLWNTVSVIMPERDCRLRWVVKLDKLGLAVSTGSACSSGKEEPSHVLSAMGFTTAQASRALRFSSGWETSPDDWHALLQALVQVDQDARVKA